MNKNVEDDVSKYVLVVSFIRVPKFGEAVICDSINELVFQDGLQGYGGVIRFFGVFVH